MTRVLSTELAGHVGEHVEIAGWLHQTRRLSQRTFLLVRDRAGITQVVIEDPEAVEAAARLLPETVLRISGDVVASDQARAGIELHRPALDVIAEPADLAPIDLRRPVVNAQLPTLLDHAAVALRHPSRRAVQQIVAASLHGFRSTLDALGFVEIATPKIVATATESGASVFALDYFGKKAFLAQSPQFYKQTMVGAFERVYEVGPVFRAEPHDTARHLAEYVSLDIELGFIDDHHDVIAVARDVFGGMVDAVVHRASPAVELLGIPIPTVPDILPTIDFRTAQQMIQDATGETVVGEPDLAPAHESWIGEWAQRMHNSEFVAVTGYPAAKRPFYTAPDPARPGFTNSFDLLFRGVEMITGGQRLHRYDDYVRAIESSGGRLEEYSGYLDAFRYGLPPHGGFGMGLERWVARLVGARNIREVTLFPRDINRLRP